MDSIIDKRFMQDLRTLTAYIFDSEEEDFNENPSEHHIYYIALKVMHGEKYANMLLEEANTERSKDESD